jgi:uracil-DNA glycosylase
MQILADYPQLFVPLQAASYWEEGITLPSRKSADILRAFSFFPLEKTRVVILGQDPYHTIDEQGNPKAWGLSFGYNPDYIGPLNSSLANIIKEIGADPETFDTSLASWARQGVLLLNTCLSVGMDKPLSHRNLGWQQVISGILKDLHDNTDCIYVAFGSEAQKVLKFVASDRLVATSHPCRFSYSRGKVPFRGSRWHELVNEKLKANKSGPIEWTNRSAKSSKRVLELLKSGDKIIPLHP